ncbi:MAG: hypothetical protein COX77_01090 [Candidatus Komeilibacteria bacterium CG_4_10_14_0_2_um_filter_37_10]|uniref:Uncharacterized protein n=1 Tax=Candidatus Komeilibacteria bacterium CG_4_10_14_0_2_um_filter_37_10 TaxID=1974470 RepID=A0A2M7VFY7_9BACT|nr:MAG: hypothetical protein COX77_01090 [Candidatus Komeilibacteria bacterium CG_4_10_14_0_2_um_filter_37_10]
MPKLHSKIYRIIIFVVGVVSTIAYRSIVVFNHYNPLLVEITWYIGTIGFVWYFAHRWSIENKRDAIITQLNLTEKIQRGSVLNQNEKDNLIYVLSGLQTSLAKWNYIAIFVLSGLSVVYAISYRLIK